jgi:predicted AAA+ superfamily ATPase
MSALHAAASYVFLDDPGARDLLDVAPSVLLEGDSPRLLDEWQLAPQLWNQVRRAVDAAAEPGRFLLTGSAVPADDATRHSGAGRFVRVRQHTMSWWERGLSRATVSVADLFAGERPRVDAVRPSFDVVLERITSPGFPAMTQLPIQRSGVVLRAYLNELSRVDVSRLAPIGHEPIVIDRLLAALARSTASEVTYRTLAADLDPVAPNIKPETVARYVDLLRRTFVVDSQPAWVPQLRSRARLRTSERLHLADPALAATALGATAARLRTDPATAGILFESAVVHDLVVLTAGLGATIHHFRDSNGHEIDVVIALPDGRWAAVEVKLGAGQVTAGARSLSAAAEQIDISAVGSPSFRLVVTGTGATFALDDGTVTCPLDALRP